MSQSTTNGSKKTQQEESLKSYDSFFVYKVDAIENVVDKVKAATSSSSTSLSSTPSTSFDLMEEAKKLFHIALPSILIQFFLSFIIPQAASVVGTTLGTVALGGFSLGSLIGNLTCLSIVEGTLSAADTLLPRAYGAQRYDEMARLAVRALVSCIILLLPPLVLLCFYAEPFLVALGQDSEASSLAQQWIVLYFLGAPASVAFRVIMRFLLAQNQPWPMVHASMLPCLFIHPPLLQYFVPRMGLNGSAIALTLTQWIMLLFLMVYLWIYRPYHSETWPGWSMKLLRESFQLDLLCRFFSLGLGGIFSLSEWWFWEIMCFIAGSFGVVSLAAHTIAYTLVPLLFMLPLGICTGLSVRMGNVLVKIPYQAAQLSLWCMIMMTGLGGLMTVCLYVARLPIIHLFISDDQTDVRDMALLIWPSVSGYVFFMTILGCNEAIYRGLGLQWRLAYIESAVLYVCLLPCVMYFAVLEGGGLLVEWKLLPLWYTFMQIILVVGLFFVDWHDISEKTRDSLDEDMCEMKGRSNLSQASTQQQQQQPSETAPLVSVTIC